MGELRGPWTAVNITTSAIAGRGKLIAVTAIFAVTAAEKDALLATARLRRPFVSAPGRRSDLGQ